MGADGGPIFLPRGPGEKVPATLWVRERAKKSPSGEKYQVPSLLIPVNRSLWRYFTSVSAEVPWWKDLPKEVSGWEIQRRPEHDWLLCPPLFKDCSEPLLLSPGYCREGSFSVSWTRECPTLASGQNWKLTQRAWSAAGLLMHSQVFAYVRMCSYISSIQSKSVTSVKGAYKLV